MSASIAISTISYLKAIFDTSCNSRHKIPSWLARCLKYVKKCKMCELLYWRYHQDNTHKPLGDGFDNKIIHNVTFEHKNFWFYLVPQFQFRLQSQNIPLAGKLPAMICKNMLDVQTMDGQDIFFVLGTLSFDIYHHHWVYISMGTHFDKIPSGGLALLSGLLFYIVLAPIWYPKCA